MVKAPAATPKPANACVVPDKVIPEPAAPITGVSEPRVFITKAAKLTVPEKLMAAGSTVVEGPPMVSTEAELPEITEVELFPNCNPPFKVRCLPFKPSVVDAGINKLTPGSNIVTQVPLLPFDRFLAPVDMVNVERVAAAVVELVES